jgi:hypothetical protein
MTLQFNTIKAGNEPKKAKRPLDNDLLASKNIIMLLNTLDFESG